jgi:hypothetical protein
MPWRDRILMADRPSPLPTLFVEPVVGLGAALATKRNPSPMLASHEYVDGQERGHQHVRHIYGLGDAKIHCHAA